jgi:hypothetical protein
VVAMSRRTRETRARGMTGAGRARRAAVGVEGAAGGGVVAVGVASASGMGRS